MVKKPSKLTFEQLLSTYATGRNRNQTASGQFLLPIDEK